MAALRSHRLARTLLPITRLLSPLRTPRPFPTATRLKRSLLTSLRYWAVNYIDAYQISNTTTGSSGTTTNTTGIWNGTSTTTMTSTTTVTRTVADASGSLSSPSVSTTSPTNPLKIGDFSYLGCFSSLSNFDTFRLVDTTSSMTLELCVSNCANEKYAGVFEKWVAPVLMLQWSDPNADSTSQLVLLCLDNRPCYASPIQQRMQCPVPRQRGRVLRWSHCGGRKLDHQPALQETSPTRNADWQSPHRLWRRQQRDCACPSSHYSRTYFRNQQWRWRCRRHHHDLPDSPSVVAGSTHAADLHHNGDDLRLRGG